MSKQVGIAIIGCGYWGINYVRIFSDLPQANIRVICDQRRERLEEIGRRFPNVQLTTDLDEALGMDGVDAAVICTPATTHYAVALRALEAGKHLLIEKPITKTSAEAEDLSLRASHKRLTLMVGHTFIYNSAVRTIKDYMDRGEAGRIYFVYARRTNMGPIRNDVNALWDLAPHDISIFNYLLGAKPDWVSAVGAKVLRNGREDVGFISLGYPGNVVGHIQVSWADAYKVREVVVVGSDRRIVFNDVNPMDRVRVFDKGVAPVEEASNYGEYQLRIKNGDVISPVIEASEPLKDECAHFVTCVAEGQYPLTDGWAGRDVVQVMEAIDLSVEQRGAPVQVGREIKETQGSKEMRYVTQPGFAASTLR